MRNIVLSLAMIALVGAAVIGGTTAFFSDEETSQGNVFAAGAIDLRIDNTSYGFDYNDPTVNEPTGVWGQNQNNSWELTDLDGELFFDFHDLKPGDYGEDTISLHVDDNDAWACMAFDLTGTPEHGQNEPEAEVDETAGEDEGELQNYLSFLFWWDDGDNVLEDDEQIIEGLSGLPGEVFTGAQLAIADSTTEDGPLEGGTTHFIGKGWCFGEITADPVDQDDSADNPPSAPDRIGFSCNGAGDHNDAQTDGIEVDVSFNAVQSRNNENFVCEGGDGIGCQEEADVMLVLDSSGSIGGDMSTLQDAAKSFVTALNPSADGVQVGVVDFDDSGTVVQTLTDNTTDINNAIDGLSSGGNTNLEEGIREGQAELDGSRAGAPDFMVIITDGDPNRSDGNDDAGGDAHDEAEDAASDAKGAGTEIFAVGVGGDLDATYLQDSIVSAPSSEHYFGSDDFDDLEQTLEELTTCPDNGDGQDRPIGAALGDFVALDLNDDQQCDVTVGSGEDFATIQEAIDDDDTADGDTICVADGVYDEDVTINKEITLSGDGAETTSVINGQATGQGTAVRIAANNVTLEGFQINGAGIAAVWLNTGVTDAEVRYNQINSANGATAVTAQGSQSNNAFRNNELVGDASTQIAYVNGDVSLGGGQESDNVDFFLNTFMGTIAAGGVVFGTESANSNFENNVIADTISSTYAHTEFWKEDAIVNGNNFNGASAETKVLNSQNTSPLNAEDNWWGDGDPSDNVGGNVDFDPFEAGPYPEN